MSASNLHRLRVGPGKRGGTNLDHFQGVRAQSESLAEPLSPEDCAAQSMPDASPAKWHLAHTTWFFETFVLEALLPGYQTFGAGFRVLFNSYYQSVGAQHPRPQRGMLTRPSLDEVLGYRAHVDRAIEALFEQGRIEGEAARVVEIGLHHEQQHQELLLTDLKHLLSRNPLYPTYRDDLVTTESSPEPVSAPPLRYERIATGIRSIGHEGAGFHFDNEGPRHEVLVPGFVLANRPVTNGEFLEFIEDGGYERPEYWLSEGWDTVRREGWRSPDYWIAAGDEAPGRSKDWRVFTLGGVRSIRRDAPVCHVSYFEADAYARWADARLPTEHEWEIVAKRIEPAGNFVETDALHPAPSGSGDTASFSQLYGDVWEWTQSPYVGYPGFRVSAGALGEYNGKFMVNQLILRGGSCATPASHIRSTYRNFFPAAARWQFSGIRLARDAG